MKLKTHHILLIIGGLLLSYLTYLPYDRSGWTIFDVLSNLGLYFVTIVLIIAGLIKSFAKIDAITTVIILLTACCVLIIQYSNHYFDEPYLLAHDDGDVNGITLSLYEDGHYEIEDYSLFGGLIHQGNHKIINDTIFLSEPYPLGEDPTMFIDQLLLQDSLLTLVSVDERNLFQLKIIR